MSRTTVGNAEPITIFGSAWDELDPERLQAFLDAADDEPLLWEAKGTELDAHYVRKTVAGFANGNESAYLILGASRTADRWALDGLQFPDEPRTWLTNVLHDGLQPAPRIADPAVWPVGDGRHIVVVRVEPLAAPPCICRGTVYERLPGVTRPVKDSARLRELYLRGEHAHAEARSAAHAIPGPAWAPDGWAGPSSRAVVSVAAIGYEADVSSRLFSERFGQQFRSSFNDLMGHQQWTPAQPFQHAQDRVTMSTLDPYSQRNEPSWTIVASWTGAVAVIYTADTEVALGSLADWAVKSAWSTAGRLTGLLGGSDRAYVTVRLYRNPVGCHAHIPVVINRGPVGRLPDSDELARIEREAARAERITTYEP